MNKLLAFAAIAEAAAGIALVMVPSSFARLLFGAELAGAGVAAGRIAGVALVSLGIACWPGRGASRSGLLAMLTYGLLVTSYLWYLGLRGETVGPLLWPAIALHAVLTALLARAWFGGAGANPPTKHSKDNQI
jgi:hypothetical protein